jgi:hypothetical protein
LPLVAKEKFRLQQKPDDHNVAAAAAAQNEDHQVKDAEP